MSMEFDGRDARYIPPRMNAAPNNSGNDGTSFKIMKARMVDPIGSPRRVMETNEAGKYLRAQLKVECPRI